MTHLTNRTRFWVMNDMPLAMHTSSLDHLQNLHVEQELTYDARDAILYALGVGAGSGESLDSDLPLVYERELKVLPSYALALAFNDMTAHYLKAGLTTGRLLHAQQHLRSHRPLAPHGSVIATTSGRGFRDMGPGKGLIYYYQTELACEDGGLIATLHASTFCLDDGGKAAGRPDFPSPFIDRDLSKRAPDGSIDIPTSANQAILYRLSGDRNPIHIDPAHARRLGLLRPPLHGRCTLGIASLALTRACCEMDADRLTSIGARFSAPAFPGETIRVEYCADGEDLSFQASTLESGKVVLTHGRATIQPK